MLRASRWGRFFVLAAFVWIALFLMDSNVKSQTEDDEVISIATVLDANGDRVLGDPEILDAIRLWVIGETPPSFSRSIQDLQILGLIRLWITGTLLPEGGASTPPTLPPDGSNANDDGLHEDDLPEGAEALLQSLSQISSQLFDEFDDIRNLRSMFKDDVVDQVEDLFIPGLSAFHATEQLLGNLGNVCPAGPLERTDLMDFIDDTETLIDQIKQDFQAVNQYQTALNSFNQALASFRAPNDPQALQLTCSPNGGQMFMSQGLDGLANQLGLMASDMAKFTEDLSLDLQSIQGQFENVASAWKGLLQSNIPTGTALFEDLEYAANMIGSSLIDVALNDAIDDVGSITQFFDDLNFSDLNPNDLLSFTDTANDSFGPIFDQEDEFGWILDGFQIYFCVGNYVTIIGTDGDDVLKGRTVDPIDGFGGGDAVDDVIAGRGGNDDISGLGGNDIICGGDGDDKILGGPGNDLIISGFGADDIDAGEGHDRVYGGPDRDTILGGTGQDLLFGNADNDIIFAGDGFNSADFDQLFGGQGNDSLVGDNSVDWIDGGDGEDFIKGKGGDDVIWGGNGPDKLHGGPGNDSIDGDTPDGVIDLSFDQRDELFGDEGDDFLFGGWGGDDLSGGPGNDTCNGGTGGGTPDTADASCETLSNVS